MESDGAVRLPHQPVSPLRGASGMPTNGVGRKYHPTNTDPMNRPIAALLLLSTSLVIAASETRTVLTIEAQPQQTIRGWGCFPGYHRRISWGAEWQVADHLQVVRQLGAELGTTFVRVDAAPDYYDASTRGVRQSVVVELVDHLRAMRDQGVSDWIMSVWSPPEAFKEPQARDGYIWRDKATGKKVAAKPGIENDAAFEKVETRLREDSEEAFATYLAAVVRHVVDQGLRPPLGIWVQNEPGDAPGYDGCKYGPEQWLRVMRLTRARLDAAGLRQVALHAADTNDQPQSFGFLGGDWSGFDDKEALRGIAGAATYHTYDQYVGDPAHRLRSAQALGAAADRLRREHGIESWMTEWCIDAASYPDGYQESTAITAAIYAMRHFARDLVVCRPNAWAWWSGWGKGAPLETNLLFGDPAKPTPSIVHGVLRTLWRSASPGVVVKRVVSSNPALVGDAANAVDLVAFDGPNAMTVLLINPTTDGLPVQLSGIARATTAQLHVASSQAPMHETGHVPIANGMAEFTLLRESITVVVAPSATP